MVKIKYKAIMILFILLHSLFVYGQESSVQDFGTAGSVSVTGDASSVNYDEDSGVLTVTSGTADITKFEGRVAFSDSTVKIGDRAYSGTGTCNAGVCVLKGSFSEGGANVVGETLTVGADGKVQSGSGVTVTVDGNEYYFDDVYDLEVEDGRISGSYNGGSEVDGLVMGSSGTFNIDINEGTIGLEGENIVITKITDKYKSRKIKGKFRFSELSGGVEITDGTVVYHSPTHLTFYGKSTFKTKEGVELRILNSEAVDFFDDFMDHSDNENSYIQSDLDIIARYRNLKVVIRNLEMINIVDTEQIFKFIKVNEGRGIFEYSDGKSVVKITKDSDGKTKITTKNRLPDILIHTESGYFINEKDMGLCSLEGCEKVAFLESEKKYREERREEVEQLISSLETDSSGEFISSFARLTQILTVEELTARVDFDASIQRLQSIYDSGDINDHLTVIKVLGATESEKVIPILDSYLNDPKTKSTVITLLVRALGDTKSDKAIPILKKYIEDNPQSIHVAIAISQLTRSRSEEVIPLLESYLGGDNFDFAIRAIADLRSERAIPILLNALEKDMMTIPAAEGLLPFIDNEEVYAAFDDMLGGRKKVLIMEVLSESNSLAVIPLLEKRLEDGDWRVSEKARRTLARLNKKEGQPKKELFFVNPILDTDIKREEVESSIAGRLTGMEKSKETITSDEYGLFYNEDFFQQRHRLSDGDLIRIRLVLESLEDESTVNSIGSLIRTDLTDKEVEFTDSKGDKKRYNPGRDAELGGLVTIKGGEASFDFYHPAIESRTEEDRKGLMNSDVNANYAVSTKAKSDLPNTLGLFHLHATELGSHYSSGPSLGDLLSSEYYGGGFVIAPLGEGRFNIDFFTKEGRVVDLGVYNYR